MLLFALSAALLFAQPAEHLSRVDGKVVDASTGLPIAGARVIAMRVDGAWGAALQGLLDTQPSADEQDPKADPVAVVTGQDGRFRLRFDGPVQVALFVEAVGYVKPPIEIGGPNNTFEVKPDLPKTDVLFTLVREAALSGRVVDADTKEPLANFRVSVMKHLPATRPAFVSAGDTTTGKDGRFSLDRIAPGDYLLLVHPPSADKIGAAKPVEDFRHAVQRSYAPTWYPGVDRREEAVAVHVAPGAGVGSVEIRLSKRRLASIRGHVCDAHLYVTQCTRSIRLSETRTIAQADVKLGSEFEVANLSPGTYCLQAVTPEKQGLMTIEVGEENQDGLDLHLTRGVALGGMVRIDGHEDDPDKPALTGDSTRVQLDKLIHVFGRDPVPAPVASQDGRFTIEGVAPSTYHVRLLSPPEGFDVAEMRYNGTPAVNGMIEVDAGVRSQELEIKLASANSAVMATVTDGDQPAADADLLLVPAGVTEEALRYASDILRVASSGKDGRATISGLLPGTYRVTAYPRGASWIDDPNLFQRLVGGDEVQLGSKQNAAITVRAQAAAGER
jgi:hypothetical protein